jgi:hypothetical protein
LREGKRGLAGCKRGRYYIWYEIFSGTLSSEHEKLGETEGKWLGDKVRLRVVVGEAHPSLRAITPISFKPLTAAFHQFFFSFKYYFRHYLI